MQESRSVGGRPGRRGAWSRASSESPPASQPDFLRPRSGRLYPHTCHRWLRAGPASLGGGQEGSGVEEQRASLHILASKAVRSWCGCVTSQEGPRDGGRICRSDLWHCSSSQFSEGGTTLRGPCPKDDERPCAPLHQTLVTMSPERLRDSLGASGTPCL